MNINYDIIILCQQIQRKIKDSNYEIIHPNNQSSIEI